MRTLFGSLRDQRGPETIGTSDCASPSRLEDKTLISYSEHDPPNGGRDIAPSRVFTSRSTDKRQLSLRRKGCSSVRI
jgi:hypothetical protein